MSMTGLQISHQAIRPLFDHTFGTSQTPQKTQLARMVAFVENQSGQKCADGFRGIIRRAEGRLGGQRFGGQTGQTGLQAFFGGHEIGQDLGQGDGLARVDERRIAALVAVVFVGGKRAVLAQQPQGAARIGWLHGSQRLCFAFGRDRKR